LREEMDPGPPRPLRVMRLLSNKRLVAYRTIYRSNSHSKLKLVRREVRAGGQVCKLRPAGASA
jgi:hypothetical protein